MYDIKTDPNSQFISLWLRPGSWNCGGRLNSAVWEKKREDFHTNIQGRV